MLIGFLLGSFLFNFVFLFFIFLYWNPVKKLFMKHFLKYNTLVNIGVDRSINTELLPKNPNKTVESSLGLKEINPKFSYYNKSSGTLTFFNIGDEVRSFDFFDHHYAEDVTEVLDKDSDTVIPVGRVYPAGDGHSKLIDSNLKNERLKAKLANSGLDLKTWILIIIALLALGALAVGILDFSQSSQAIQEAGGQVLFG